MISFLFFPPSNLSNTLFSFITATLVLRTHSTNSHLIVSPDHLKLNRDLLQDIHPTLPIHHLLVLITISIVDGQ